MAAVRELLVCWGEGGDVMVMVVPARGGFLESIWGDNGCDRMSLTGESYTFRKAYWRCLAVPVLFRLSVPLAISALGGDVLHPSCVLSWWTDCVWVVVAWLLWSGFGGCVAGVVPIWCGLVFSLSVDVK